MQKPKNLKIIKRPKERGRKTSPRKRGEGRNNNKKR